jgi:hypothetical protein
MFHDVVFVLFECLSACLSNVETVRASKRASKSDTKHEASMMKHKLIIMNSQKLS